jgi:signal transduction histidine kinase
VDHGCHRRALRISTHRASGHFCIARSGGQEIILSADPREAAVPYPSGVAFDESRPPWAQPRVGDAPGPTRRDWLLVAAIAVVAVAETLAREQVVWPGASLVLTIGLACLLPWRRTHPLALLLASFGAVSLLEVASLVADAGWEGLDTASFLLVLPYALARWGSGRDAGIGLVALAVPLALAGAGGDPVGVLIGGALALLLSFAIGVTVRYAAELRAEEIAGLRARERAELARELHDTVAHHVSAIAVQAQAGRVVAAARPEAALEALAVIEEEAARALEEMRSMVGALRNAEEGADLRPQQGLRDLSQLERSVGASGPRVVVELDDGLGELRPAVDAACYRLAQEAVTNAQRHARDASQVTVRVDGDHETVRLRVVDDGRSSASAGAGVPTPGFGLVGMAERARLLGGTFEAGPRAGGGWVVEATLPRRPVAS